jgi:hypothetical protein
LLGILLALVYLRTSRIMTTLRHLLALAPAALLLRADPVLAIDSVVHGAVVEVGFGTNAAGDAVMGDLGAAWIGIRSDAAGLATKEGL